MESNSEAKAMSYLPLDITINILTRLPVKYLGQLKCTCKSWNSLISSPRFIKLQHDRAILDANDLYNNFRLFMYKFSRSFLLDYESPSSVTNPSRSFQVDTENIMGENLVNHVGSCYGFIYFVCFEDCIILWNPCIKQARNLPNPPTPSGVKYSYARYFYGLGYGNDENTTCEYKMVRIIQWGFPKTTEVEVFDVQNSSSWRSIEAFDNDINILDEKGTFANGAIHWKATRGTGSDRYEMILSLDMKNETFKEILIPNLGGRSDSFWFLGGLKGRLCLQVGGDGNDHDIWAMKEYGVEESWTRLVSYKWGDFDCNYGLSLICFAKNGDGLLNANGCNLIRIDSLERGRRYFKKRTENYFDGDFDCNYGLSLICFAKNGDGLLNANGCNLIRIDSLERGRRYFKKRTENYFDCFMYVESLVSPHGDSLVG